MMDQANELRKKMKQKEKRKKTRILAVTSGKGGVGKSNFVLNFALALVRQNKKVLIIDVDLGFANVDILLGKTPKETLASMIEKDLPVADIIEQGPEGLQFIAGGSGFTEVFSLSEPQMNRFFEELAGLQGTVDYVLLDTGAGLTEHNLRFILAADDVILVTTPEPTSITDAYAIVKVVSAQDPDVHFKLVINQVTSDKEGSGTIANFQSVASRFLDKEIGALGCIPHDRSVPAAVKAQLPFLIAAPNDPAAKAIERTAAEFLEIQLPYKLGMKGFLLKMLFRQGKTAPTRK